MNWTSSKLNDWDKVACRIEKIEKVHFNGQGNFKRNGVSVKSSSWGLSDVVFLLCATEKHITEPKNICFLDSKP